MIQTVIAFVQKYRVDIALALVVLVVAGVPRLADLGLFLTADEKNWIGRSYEFIRAFKDWRFNDMLQTTHPGVTTLWIAGVAVTLQMVLSHIPFSFRNLVHFVSVTQFPVALLNTLAVPVMYVLLRQIFGGRRVPLTAALLIALDPFLIGYSRLVHVDALLASFLFCAALITVIYALRGYSRFWLVASSVVSALALLTKVPALFIIPYFWLVVLVFEKKKLFSWTIFRERLRDFLLWGLIAGIVIVLVWPALLWVPNPEGNVLVLKRDISVAALTPHHMSEDYSVNPLHYPATLLTRVTLPVQFFVLWSVGVLFALFVFRVRMRFIAPESAYAKAWLLLCFYVFFFIIAMTMGAKKGDRYILPVFPALSVLASLGIMVWAREKKRAFLVLAGALCGFLVFTVYSFHPYALAYSNPLFPDNVSQELGWGEGLDQVAAWFNEHDPDAIVASWYPEELGAYTSAHVAHLNAHQQVNVEYVVLYRNMFGRAPDHPANDFIDEYYKKRVPVYVATIGGKEFAWVYRQRVFESEYQLVSGKIVGQKVTWGEYELAGIDLLMRKFSNPSRFGDVMVVIRDRPGGRELYRWHVKPDEIQSDRWFRLLLPQRLASPAGEGFVEVFVIDASEQAPFTIRYTTQEPRRSTPVESTEHNTTSRVAGDLALRLVLSDSDVLVTENDDKLVSPGFLK